MKKAVICISGGLDSATCLAYANSQGFDCYALSFDYGQRSHAEIEAAKILAKKYASEHRIFQIGINQFKHSALTDLNIAVPTEIAKKNEIPVTYVPARNTIFLSIALAWAEVIGAKDIFMGANVIDYSNYPDCRDDYLKAFERMANLATRVGVQEGGIKIHAPLLNLTKAETILLGTQLGLDYAITVSCYQAAEDGAACGVCSSCRIRKKGFIEANVSDVTRYKAGETDKCSDNF